MAKGRGDLVVGGDRPKVAGVEVVELSNEKVDIFRGEGVVLLQVIKSNKGKGSREIPPKDVKRGARVLGGTNNMHHWDVERKGRRDMDLNYNQGVMMDSRAPLKVVEHTDKKRGCSKTSV